MSGSMYEDGEIPAGNYSAYEIREMLEAPFDASEVRFRQGANNTQLAYIRGVDVIRRLNASTNTWSFSMAKSSMQSTFDRSGDEFRMFMVEGHLTIPELGTRPGVGVQVLRDGSGEDMFKGAYTDAIKNAAARFGVGLDLYGGQPAGPQRSGGGYAAAPSGGQSYPQQPPPPQQYAGVQRGAATHPVAQPSDRLPGGATQKQAGAIYAIRKGLGMEEPELNTMITGMFNGKGAVEDLTSGEASNLIKYLDSLQVR